MARSDLSPAEMPVLLIPVDQIDVPLTRLRSLKAAQADAIGAAIVADGQYDPITVTAKGDRFELVDGLHRLEGHRLHELRLIEARVVPDDSEALVRQEVLSSVARASHDVFDKAAQFGALAAMARQKAGKPSIGDLRKLNGFLSIAEVEAEAEADFAIVAKSLDWAEATAAQMDCSPRKVRQYALLSERFTAEMIEVLRGRELANELVPLTRLAALEPFRLGGAIGLIEYGSCATIAEALSAVGAAAAPTPFNKKLNRFTGWVDELDVRERRQVIEALLEKYRPDGRPKAAEK